ncbi:mannitol dehydrogenase family protein [Glaciibacter sp. 2TAF33]|uniref:mannitol dehydrogenase family protein n=1 Tax=Glaciibacter sp. 2TAF33 TaxID=3233015 RepID=UPI003F90E832
MSSTTDAVQTPLLTRESLARRTGVPVPTPGVRIVHLGLGAFHRAHQAWYTAQVDETAEWGIASFTGRNPTAAEELIPQDGLYTLIERSERGDSAAVITSIVEAVSGADLDRLVELLAAPETAIVTTTITEAGYRLTADGQPNLGDPAVAADAAWVKAAFAEDALPDALYDGPTTSLARLLLGLEARRRAGAGPIAVVPCDNMPDNGAFVAAGIAAMARAASAATAEWIAENVSFVSTSVDRITPRTTPADLASATELTGWTDNAAVVTEPFTDWVLSGDFPAGRPDWEKAGARFVEDIEPFERRKLWLLNGAHSLLAYAGLLRGHQTVAAAMRDALCRGWVDEFWNEAVRHLPAEGLDLDAYRAALVERFDNARIEHKLAQISSEGVTKLRVRVAPTVLSERAAGRSGAAGIRAIGSWVALALSGYELVDGESGGIAAALAQPHEQAIDALVTLVDAKLTADSAVMAGIRSVVEENAAA